MAKTDPIVPAPITAEQLDAIVEDWFADRFRNRAVSRYTVIYNNLIEAKAALKEKLRALVIPQAAPVITNNEEK